MSHSEISTIRYVLAHLIAFLLCTGLVIGMTLILVVLPW